MKYSTTNNGLPAGNPIANFFVVVVGILAIGASIVLGFFAFIVIASLVLIMASVIGIRVWWFKRRLRGQVQNTESRERNAQGGVIEGEYQVIADEDKGE